MWSCHCGGKNRIDLLNHEGMILVQESEKAQAIFDHFNSILGQYIDREHNLNFEPLGLPIIDTTTLDSCFPEDEVWSIVRAMPSKKAPGSNGFKGLFYQTAWPCIKRDILQDLNSLWSMDFRSLYLLNQAYMVLLRKKELAEEVKHFRPINLIHSFTKLFAKVLSSRLAPLMPALVKPNQSTFSCGHAIHDNFRAVHTAAKLLHARRKVYILFKIDITKVFDSVNWAFLLDLLGYLGFSCHWVH
jgi:hypothetical protein